MIPHLVRQIAAGHQTDNLKAVEAILRELRASHGSAPICHPPQQTEEPDPIPNELAPLAIRPLVPQQPPVSPISDLLDLIELETLVPNLKSRGFALSVKSGLYLIHDYLDAAHELAQKAEEPESRTTAAYWHGIVHRREPDYDNARYWFRRVGSHAILQIVGHEAAELLGDAGFHSLLSFDRIVDRRGHWDPTAFVALCEQCGRKWDARAAAAARLQEIEMRRLIEYSCRAAMGEP